MDSSELGVVREYFSFRVEVGPWVSTSRGLMLSHLGSGWVGQIMGKAEGLHQMLQVTIQWQEETVCPAQGVVAVAPECSQSWIFT